MSDAKGRTVKLFLVDGTPTGLITAEIMDWTGHVVALPRSLLPEFGKRIEAMRTGLYILLGLDAEHPDQPTAYIGETDEAFTRLKQHAGSSEKDFFDRVIVVTSKDDLLTKAHVKHLEQLVYGAAVLAANYRVIGVEPGGAKLPESDVADMAFFLQQIEIILPVLGVDLLRRAHKQVTAKKTAEPLPHATRFSLTSKSGASALAVEQGGEFIVLKGSVATKEEHTANSYAALRKKLINSGKLEEAPDGKRYEFTQDVAFDAPSAASATILNRNDNGRNSWKLEGTGKTYGQWSSEQMNNVLRSSATAEELGL